MSSSIVGAIFGSLTRLNFVLNKISTLFSPKKSKGAVSGKKDHNKINKDEGRRVIPLDRRFLPAGGSSFSSCVRVHSLFQVSTGPLLSTLLVKASESESIPSSKLRSRPQRKASFFSPSSSSSQSPDPGTPLEPTRTPRYVSSPPCLFPRIVICSNPTEVLHVRPRVFFRPSSG